VADASTRLLLSVSVAASICGCAVLFPVDDLVGGVRPVDGGGTPFDDGGGETDAATEEPPVLDASTPDASDAAPIYEWKYESEDTTGCNSCEYSCSAACSCAECNASRVGHRKGCKVDGTNNNEKVYRCILRP